MVIWHVWDGDGAIDNTLGAQPMFTAGFNPTVAESLASGALLVALELYGHDAGLPWGEEQCTAVYLWSVLDGDMPPDPRDNFSGNEAFVTAPGYGNLGDVLLSGAGDLAVSGDMATLTVPMGPTQLRLELCRVRLEATRRADGSWTDGMLGGGIDSADLLQQLQGVALPPGATWEQFLGQPDLELDGDDRADALSIGIGFSAANATLIGADGPVASKPR